MKYTVSGHGDNGVVSMSISGDRYHEIKHARTTLFLALDIEEKCALLLENYYEFECELLKLAQSMIVYPRIDIVNSMLERLLLNRRLINFLTACRLYSEQTEHVLSCLFGKTSTELVEFKKLKNNQYDSFFGYRFMEAIRNHVQHFGLVVDGSSFQQSLIPGPIKDYSTCSYAPTTQLETLSINPSFKKSVLAEVALMKQPIDLRQPIREYVSCIIRLHEHIRKVTESHIKQQRFIYEAAIEEFKSIDNKRAYLATLKKEDEAEIHEEFHLVDSYLKHYDFLIEKRSSGQGHESTCASNGIQLENR